MDWSHVIVGISAVFVGGLIVAKVRKSSHSRSFHIHIDYDTADKRELGEDGKRSEPE